MNARLAKSVLLRRADSVAIGGEPDHSITGNPMPRGRDLC